MEIGSNKPFNIPDDITANQAGDLKGKMLAKDKEVTDAAAVSVHFHRLRTNKQVERV